jgi:diguanylate cyclase (GGDEF)-like protein/PAS domain S-box-containing protein
MLEDAASQAGTGAGSRPHVLVVDDEKQVLVALEDLLEQSFRVTVTDQPARALQLAEADPSISVVVSDQRMPGMNGDELLARLRHSSAASRILCTGYADISAVVRAVNDGNIFAYVTKPWDGVDLRLKVQHAADYFRLTHELSYEKQLLGDLMRSVPDAIFFKDTRHRYIRVNRAFLSAFGASSMNEVVGKRLSELPSGSVSGPAIEASERQILADGVPRRDLMECALPSGEKRWLSTTRAAVRSPEGKVIGLIGISQDITDSVRTQEALRISEERLRLAFMAANAGLFDWNLQTGETLYSQATSELQGAGQTAVEDFAALEARVHPEDVPQLRAALNAHFEHRTPLKALEIRARNRDDVYRWFEISAQAAFNEQGRPIRLVGANVDVTERRERAHRLARLDHLALHDELTGLPNRARFSGELSRQLAGCRERSERLALVAVDIVRFRHVNETLGRRGGDELLQEVARRLATSIRPTDLLVRFDSNTFMVIMSGIEHESDAAQWIEQSTAPLSQPLSIQGTELRLSTKAGIALFPSDGDSEDALIANAEAALKQAKHSALPYMFYAPSMNSRVADKLRLEAKLRRALLNDELVLYYQPKIDLKSREILGVEALIRWHDPERGLVAPGQFIPILEETELILPVGQWVIERAAEQYRQWSQLGISVPRIAVNVSALQLAQRDFVASLDAILARHPGAAQGLDIELTESVLMDDLTGNIEKLQAAKERGLQVAIDDFGTGYSSLGYLSRLPLDALKIDRSFIADMADDPQQMSIVTAVISLAHAIDLKVIAEGVETPTQAQLLRLLRCDQIQGYLIARPQPAAELTHLLGRPLDVPRQ